MPKVGEHLSLGAKALDGVGFARARADELEGDLLLVVAVHPFRKVDRTHATASQNIHETPRSEACLEPWIDAPGARGTIRDDFLDGQRAMVAGGRQHLFELVAQRDVAATGLGEKPLASLRRLCLCELEEFLDSRPARALHSRPPVIAPGRAGR